MSPRHFLFLTASTRAGGNSEQLARHAATLLPAEVPTTWIRLDEHPLPPFEDVRHSGVFPEPVGHAHALASATLAATDLVIVSPVYWYSLPAAAKLYFDHWSAWLRSPTLDFRARMRGRRLWAVIVDSSEAHEQSSAPLVDMLFRTADYMDMAWMGALIGHGNRPGDALADRGALEDAARFFASSAIVSAAS